MPHLIGLPEGSTISHPVGRVLIRLTVVRPGASYRVSVCHGSTGVEVPELTANFPSEAEARRVARSACYAFAGGETVDRVLATTANVLDAALAASFGGGNGTGHTQSAVPVLTAAREALSSDPADVGLAASITETMQAAAIREGLYARPARHWGDLRDRHQAAMQDSAA